jgi:hypothetical protein
MAISGGFFAKKSGMRKGRIPDWIYIYEFGDQNKMHPFPGSERQKGDSHITSDAKEA